MKIQASLVARSATRTCSEISDLAGLAPDDCRERGETVRAGQTPSVETVWKLRGPSLLESTVEDSIDALLDRLAPHIDGLSRLPKDIALDIDCVIYREDGEQAPAIGLSRNAIHLLARLNAEFGASIY